MGWSSLPVAKVPTWDPSKPGESLDGIVQSALQQAEATNKWYLDARLSKGRWATRLRLAALLFTGIAGVFPIIIGMFPPEAARPIYLSPGWGSVALALAALFISIDRFFGHSTSWIRFVVTANEVRQLIHEFRFDWEKERSQWPVNGPSTDRVQHGLSMCRSFLWKVDEAVKKETNNWLSEFQDALKQIDQAARESREASQLGAANVVLTNGGQVASGWSLTVDRGAEVSHSGTTASVNGLRPGIRVFTAKGMIGQKACSAEKAHNIAAGSVESLELTLT